MKKIISLVFLQCLIMLSACAQKQENPATEEAGTSQETLYIDIVLPNTEGQTIKVSDYVPNNKYTLVDFWASWCGPCRMEMPNVVKAYERFRDKGLEIVGVSLDNNKDMWVKAISDLGMEWPQMSDLKGWQCEGAVLYGVRAIPANVLINQKGEIVATNLRDEALQTTLAELLGE